MAINKSEIVAVTFDVGGTVVNWYEGMIGQLERFGDRRDLDVDWPSLLATWRVKGPGLALNSRPEDLPGGNLDGVHRHVLDEVLEEFDLEGVSEADRDEMTQFWHNLPPWPDAPSGLARLREEYVVSTTTAMSVPMIINISREGKINWDCVICCEMLDRYKFHPSAYKQSAKLQGYDPEQMLFVAAHELDLQAAEDAGFPTAYIERPDEWGDIAGPDQAELLQEEFAGKFDTWASRLEDFEPDLVADDIGDLAGQLGT